MKVRGASEKKNELFFLLLLLSQTKHTTIVLMHKLCQCNSPSPALSNSPSLCFHIRFIYSILWFPLLLCCRAFSFFNLFVHHKTQRQRVRNSKALCKIVLKYYIYVVLRMFNFFLSSSSCSSLFFSRLFVIYCSQFMLFMQ